MNGFCHIGFLERLHKENFLEKVDTIVSTSIGSVIAALFAIGYTPTEIFSNLVDVNHTILKYEDLLQFFYKFGAESGEYFMAYLMDLFLKKNVAPTITFAQLEKEKGIRLVITGSNLNRQEAVYYTSWSLEKDSCFKCESCLTQNRDQVENFVYKCSRYRDMSVLEAVRISISIPFLFTAVQKDDCLMVDGGVTDNFPIEYAYQDLLNRHRIQNEDLLQVVREEDVSTKLIGCNICTVSMQSILSLESYLYSVICCSFQQKYSPKLVDCTVTVPLTMINSSIAFDASVNDKMKLLDIGKEKTDHFLKCMNGSKLSTTNDTFNFGSSSIICNKVKEKKRSRRNSI